MEPTISQSRRKSSDLQAREDNSKVLIELRSLSCSWKELMNLCSAITSNLPGQGSPRRPCRTRRRWTRGCASDPDPRSGTAFRFRRPGQDHRSPASSSKAREIFCRKKKSCSWNSINVGLGIERGAPRKIPDWANPENLKIPAVLQISRGLKLVTVSAVPNNWTQKSYRATEAV